MNFVTEPPKFGGRITATAHNPETVTAVVKPAFAVPALPTVVMRAAMALSNIAPTTDKIKPPAIMLPHIPENIKSKPKQQ